MLDWERDTGPSYYRYSVEMTLASSGQPALRKLTCAKQTTGRGDRYPRLDEIRRALGNSIDIVAATA